MIRIFARALALFCCDFRGVAVCYNQTMHSCSISFHTIKSCMTHCCNGLLETVARPPRCCSAGGVVQERRGVLSSILVGTVAPGSYVVVERAPPGGSAGTAASGKLKIVGRALWPKPCLMAYLISLDSFLGCHTQQPTIINTDITSSIGCQEKTRNNHTRTCVSTHLLVSILAFIAFIFKSRQCFVEEMNILLALSAISPKEENHKWPAMRSKSSFVLTKLVRSKLAVQSKLSNWARTKSLVLIL